MSDCDYWIIGIYLFIIFSLGILAGKGIRTVKEYAVANQSFGAGVLFATLSASFIGGGFSFGNADTVFHQGIFSSVALWGFSLMLFFVGLFIAPRVGAFRDCISVGDIMEKQLGMPERMLAGLLGASVCMGILAAQVGAMGTVFTLFTPLNFIQGTILGCAIVIIYTAAGGMRSVVFTDVVQFCLLVICIPLTLFIGIYQLGGVTEFMDKTPDKFFAMPNDGPGWIAWISLFLAFLIGETLVPPYVQRLLIGRNATETKKGTLWSAWLSLPFFIITGLIGIMAFILNPDIESKMAMPSVISTVLPIGLKGLACAAIISIVMSSADSFLNASSVCLVEDVIFPLQQKTKATAYKKNVLILQLLTIIIGIGAIVIAIKIENVLNILKFAYNFWAPVILFPLVCILLGKKVNRIAFWCCAAVGVTVIILMFALKPDIPVDSVVLATLLSGTTFLLVNGILNKNDTHITDHLAVRALKPKS